MFGALELETDDDDDQGSGVGSQGRGNSARRTEVIIFSFWGGSGTAEPCADRLDGWRI